MCEKGGLCILRIHDIFSACVVWFTFVFRTQEHRAVGSSGIGLTDSRGSFPCGTAFPSPLELSITHLTRFVKRFFLRSWNFFILYFCGQCAPCLSLQQSVLSEEMATCHTPSGKYLISSPLDNYSIAFREYFVNSFFRIFRRFFSLTL